MFVNLTSATIFDIFDWEHSPENFLSFQSSPLLFDALSELVNEPINLNTIYQRNVAIYGRETLNFGYIRTINMIETSKRYEEIENTLNAILESAQFQIISKNVFDFRFSQIHINGIEVRFNVFTLDEGHLTGFEFVAGEREKVTDLVTNCLNGMPHDDLHTLFPPLSYSTDTNKYSEMLFSIFGGERKLNNYEAFIIGLHASRLKFTIPGQEILQQNIHDLYEMFDACAECRNAIVTSNLGLEDELRVLDSLQYLEAMAMRAAWHLMQPGEAAYTELEAHFDGICETFLQKAKQTDITLNTAIQNLCPAFAQIFGDVHAAMTTELSSNELIHIGDSTLTPMELIAQMHRDPTIARKIAYHLLDAQRQDLSVRTDIANSIMERFGNYSAETFEL